MDDILYDKDLNNVNIELYNRFGTDYPEERWFRCVCCKDPTRLDEGYSSRGHRMICERCFNTKFDGNILKARDWWQEDLYL